jgi:hypothetical protein
MRESLKPPSSLAPITCNIISLTPDEIKLTCTHRFLLAQIHLVEMKDATSVEDIRQRLRELPKSLGEYVSRFVDRIRIHQEQGLRTMALRILSLIVLAKETLTVSDLRWAIAFWKNPGRRVRSADLPPASMVISICGGLIFQKPYYYEGLGPEWATEEIKCVRKLLIF